MIYKSTDISEYVLRYIYKTKEYRINVLQLMDILYFVQAQFLVNKNQRAFAEDIVAKDWSVFIESVWSKYKIYCNSIIPVHINNFDNVCKKIYHSDALLVNDVVILIHGSSWKLMNIIREQTPYINGLNNYPTFTITDTDMKKFFS